MRFRRSSFNISVVSALISFAVVGCTTPARTVLSNTAPIQTIAVNAVSVDGVGKKIGTIHFQDTPQGLSISTQLSDLPSGYHGFHLHEKGSCDPAEKEGKIGAAIAAGGHFNPHKAEHGTPNAGHLGDLPVLNVDSNGTANSTVIAPRLKLANVQGLAILIHAGGDNYSDHPKPLGGGGDRIACGVIR